MPPLGRARRLRSGFTLFELLAVIAIMGILIAVIAPQFGGSREGTALVLAARGVAQASRYAHAMALLHQARTELVITPSNGTIEVRAAPGRGGAGQNTATAANTDATTSDDADDYATDDDADATKPDHGAPLGASAAQSFDSNIHTVLTNPGVTFEFDGYTDSVDAGRAGEGTKAADAAEDGEPFSVVFDVNGRNRPFSIRAVSAGGDSLSIRVNMFGQARIEGYGDEK